MELGTIAGLESWIRFGLIWVVATIIGTAIDKQIGFLIFILGGSGLAILLLILQFV